MREYRKKSHEEVRAEMAEFLGEQPSDNQVQIMVLWYEMGYGAYQDGLRDGMAAKS
jgi:hypothetical protein